VSRPGATGWSNAPWYILAASFAIFTGPRFLIWVHDTLAAGDDALDCWPDDDA
jgi:hypothetical protein